MTGPLLLRTMMFVPGHNRRLLESAARSDADALILDLEDSVRPDDQKPAARETSSPLWTRACSPGIPSSCE